MITKLFLLFTLSISRIGGQVLWTGPGAKTMGNSEVLSLPGLHHSKLWQIPPHPQTSLQGSVAQVIGNTIHVCGGLLSDGEKHNGSSSMLQTCYNFTALESQWVPAKNMTEKRWGAASVQMEDGAFWVTGGFSSQILNSTELWKNGIWEKSIELPKALEFHCMVQINSTHTFLAGGWTDTGGTYGSFSSETWIYTNGYFIKQHDMPVGRFSHSCATFNDQIWVVGGQQGFSSQLKSVEIFSLSTLTWMRGPDLPVPTTGGQLIHHEGMLLFLGGVIGEEDEKTQTKDIYKLDGFKENCKWIKVPQVMNTPRAHFNALVWTPRFSGEDRDNLTLRVTAKCPQSWNYSYYLGGAGAWLSSESNLGALLPMVQVSNDTWQFDIKYKSVLAGYSCSNCYANDIIRTGDNLHIRIFALKGKDLVPMKGVMTTVKFPISETSSFFNDPAEVTIAPNFDNLHGEVHSVTANHPLFGERVVAVYLPPDFFNPYKQFPVTIVIDAKQTYLEQLQHAFDDWFTTGIVQTVIVGFGDWKGDTAEAQYRDRMNLLTPVVGDGFTCKNGSLGNLCNGCLDPTNISLAAFVKCSHIIQVGGGADQLLDWMMGDILLDIEKKWPGRLLTDRDHLGVVGYSLGGLFACHAAWTRHEEISRAACQSSSFWWPRNANNGTYEFDFINKTLIDPKFSINRFPQKILIDVGEAEGDEEYSMVRGAQFVAEQMEKHPAFYKNENLWLHVYPGKKHSLIAFIQRIWNAVKIMWN